MHKQCHAQSHVHQIEKNYSFFINSFNHHNLSFVLLSKFSFIEELKGLLQNHDGLINCFEVLHEIHLSHSITSKLGLPMLVS